MWQYFPARDLEREPESRAEIEGSCPVCGDRVSGYHYGLLTCESCKVIQTAIYIYIYIFIHLSIYTFISSSLTVSTCFVLSIPSLSRSPSIGVLQTVSAEQQALQLLGETEMSHEPLPEEALSLLSLPEVLSCGYEARGYVRPPKTRLCLHVCLADARKPN